MSSFIGMYSDEYAYLATDTLVRWPYEKGDIMHKPLVFANKVYHLPHLKSAFGVTGTQQLGTALYIFLNEHCIGTSINSIVHIDLNVFAAYLAQHYDERAHGTIYLYGLDVLSNTFKGYWMVANKGAGSFLWNAFKPFSEDGWCAFPDLEPDHWNRAQEVAVASEAEDLFATFMLETIKIQKEEDEKKPLTERVGIGGEVVITLITNGETGFQITSLVVYKFADYELHFERMLNSSR